MIKKFNLAIKLSIALVGFAGSLAVQASGHSLTLGATLMEAPGLYANYNNWNIGLTTVA